MGDEVRVVPLADALDSDLDVVPVRSKGRKGVRHLPWLLVLPVRLAVDDRAIPGLHRLDGVLAGLLPVPLVDAAVPDVREGGEVVR
eukprot:14633830-Heterocapsa_arctica.AAC.1